MKKLNKIEAGQIYPTKNYDPVEVIEYINSSTVIVKFTEYPNIVTCSSSNLRKGVVKNKLYPSVSGVGCVGIGDHSPTKTIIGGKSTPTKEYLLWKSVLDRCYTERCLKLNPSYREVSVCERWLNFQNFAEDLPTLTGYRMWVNCQHDRNAERIHLDKDLKIAGNKVYSPEACCFIPASINSKLAVRK